jgi:4-aminobutyrate aminotransferase-like enzyme
MPSLRAGVVRRKLEILALENSFHGRTFGAVSITYPEKYREPFAPLVPGVEFVRFNDVADLERKFDDTVCAIVVETIQGEGGIFPVSEAFWNRARALATQHDAALIADEIQCGLGRTGRYFAYQKFERAPDVVAIAKPLAGGLPAGRDHRERAIRFGVYAWNARHNFWRRPSRLRGCSASPERHRKKEPCSRTLENAALNCARAWKNWRRVLNLFAKCAGKA